MAIKLLKDGSRYNYRAMNSDERELHKKAEQRKFEMRQQGIKSTIVFDKTTRIFNAIPT